MDKNTDERIVTMDAKLFDEFRKLAYQGAYEYERDTWYDVVMRHVKKFNPRLEGIGSEVVADDIGARRAYGKRLRQWAAVSSDVTVYLKGWRDEHRPTVQSQPYLFPVKVIGLATPAGDNQRKIIVELQAYDDYQRESYLRLLKDCLKDARRGWNQSIRSMPYRFTGHPVPGGSGVLFSGQWSRHQCRRACAGRDAKLYLAVYPDDLIAKVPDSYQPCSGLFQGIFFLPT